jgi:deoxycytidylate deaminase
MTYLNCSKQMYQAGVERVIYDEQYRSMDGVNFLKRHGVFVEQYSED